MNEFESERGHKPLRHGDGLWVRYGGLSPLAQEKFVRDPEQRTFHSPPCRRGIFAFPSGYVERFLLGATCAPGHVSHKTRWLRDETGEKLEYAKHMTLSRDSNNSGARRVDVAPLCGRRAGYPRGARPLM